MLKPIDIICMGRVAVDLYGEQIGKPLAEVETFRKYLGGCAGNVAIGTARLGLKSAMLSCVGRDAMGQFLKDTLRHEKVNISALQETNHHLTGLVLLGIIPPDHFPLIFYRKDCADMQLKVEHVNPDFIASAKALFITGTGLSSESMRQTTHYAVDCAMKVNTRVIFDLDYRPVLWGLTDLGDGESRYKISNVVSEHYRGMLPKSDLIVGTEEEIFIAGNATTLELALQNIRKMSQAPIVVKRGAKGAEVHLAQESNPLISPPFPVTVLNVLGAGDAFISGLMRGLLRKESWEVSAAYANACGAIVVTRHGCAPAMPTFSEVMEFMQQNDESGRKKHVALSYSSS